MPERTTTRARLATALASAAGAALRVLPGAAGAALVSWGAGLAWPPLGLATAGAFLLMLDRRMP